MDAADISGIGALAEPVRRALYTYVVSQPDAVGREAAAAGAHVPVHTAKFHLDRLVEDGLLEVEYRRLTGRSGPGAGRPAKLYRRSDRQFTVSLPERRYDLVGDILATAVQRATDGTPLPEALHETAHAEGHKLGSAAEPREAPALDRLAETLEDQGFEPRTEGGTLVLANCPFDTLAQKHTELVCGLNLSYVQGVAEGLGCPRLRAFLEPGPGHCCVKATS